MSMFAIPDPIFQRAMRLITAITNDTRALVTTSFDHDYITGQIVRILIPPDYGMPQINQQLGRIEVTSPTTFLIDIDTSFYQPFVIPPTNPGRNYTPAQVVPVGEIPEILAAATVNVLNPNF